MIVKNVTKCFVDLAGGRRLGQVVKMNRKTMWVKVMRGARTYDIIKRHMLKHHVGGFYFEFVHTPIEN